MRTEAAPSDSKDGGVDGWTPEYGLDPELYAPIWRLEQAVEQYLDVRDGIRGGADANTEMRLDTLGKLRSAGFDTVYAEIKPHIDQRWRWCDLKQAINNVREQHRQEVEREQEAKPGNPWAPPLTPIAREEPVVQEEPQPEPASPREPSAWAPDLAPEKPEQEPFSDDVTLTVTISGAREPQKRKVSVSVTTYKHGRKLSEEYYGRPPAGMSELYAEINAVLVRVLDPEVLALAGSPPDHCGVEAAETVPQPPQLDSFPVGTWVRCGSRTGQVTEWIASGRVVVFRGEDGKTHRFPAFMVHAMYAEPA